MANVIFKVGTLAQYEALEAVDSNTLYWLTDAQALYKGDVLFGIGAAATTSAAGLLSAEDKAKLDSLVSGSGSITLSEVEGNILEFKEDGLFAEVPAITIESVEGLEDRLSAVESAAVGGVHYKGSVATTDELPEDAEQGDLYEVTADNSEWCWNGTAWFEYGNTAGLMPIAYADLNSDQMEIDEDGVLNIKAVDAEIVTLEGNALEDALNALYMKRKYEVTNGLLTNSLVSYQPKEIRIMFPEDSEFAEQAGNNGDTTRYYVGFRAYAPEGAVSFKEDIAETISDETMYYFVDNEFAGTDAYGRNYSVIWLPVAKYEDEVWTYMGSASSTSKYTGWYYSVEWYDADGNLLDADTIRINLSNESCHTAILPYYAQSYVTTTDLDEAVSAAVETAVADVAESVTWQDM